MRVELHAERNKICSTVADPSHSLGDPVPGFVAPPVCVWQQRSVKAVGNRNTMAATLSLTQVTLSYNSNITTTRAFCPLSVPFGHISGVLLKPGGQKSSHSSLFVSLF